ncbi:MAG TPA: DUF445 domain-containing protein [Micropepsaceae bacterium]|nr:DUF445 domain-containing protein [Micropepsaceae bacterium]
MLQLKRDYDAKRQALRRNRRLAGGLLLVATFLFLTMQLIDAPGFAARLVIAAAEAAIVGGLADWFAVTALFRHPLGLPIPHTALIPSQKDAIGRSLGNFVRDQFLDPALLIQRLRAENRALLLARWLDSEAAAAFLSQRVVDIVPVLLKSANDEDVRRFIANVAGEAFRRIDVVPVFDAVVGSLVASGKHMEFVDALTEILEPSLQALREPIIERVAERTGRFFPRYFDRKIAEAILNGLKSWLAAVRNPESEERLKLDAWIRRAIGDFRASPDYAQMLAAAQAAIAANPALLHGLEAIWDEVKREMMQDVQSPTPQIGVVTARIVRTIGRLLAEMPTMQDYVNGALERIIVDYIAPWRNEISNFIADVVKSWDGPKVAEIIELEVGSDLQYIRINGTLVGAAIGMLLFLIGAAIPALRMGLAGWHFW